MKWSGKEPRTRRDARGEQGARRNMLDDARMMMILMMMKRIAKTANPKDAKVYLIALRRKRRFLRMCGMNKGGGTDEEKRRMSYL
jgi:hypothetical protein